MNLMENLLTGEKIKHFCEFHLDIYNRTYLLCVGLTKDEANRKIGDRLGVTVDVGDVQDLHGFVDKVKGKDVTAIVIFLHDLELSTVAHEAVHAASFTFSHAGIKADADNDEPFAYLVGWIVKKIFEVTK